jgi:DHA2 family methylenomycin A resistance protein-like MFS transporter
VRSLAARIRATSWAVVVAPTLGAFLFSADTISIQIANPAIGAALDTGLDGLQWAANGFLLPFCVFLVPMGTLADKLGPRRVLLAGIAVFAVGQLLGSFAQSIEMLVAGRVLAGIGGAAMMPAGISALRLQIPESRLVGAMAIWAAGAMGGVAAGGVASGLLLEVVSWRGVLWPLAGGAAICFLISALTLEDRRAERVQQLKPVWSAGFALGLAAVVWGLIRAGAKGWGSPDALVPIGVGLAAFAVTAVLAVPELRRTARDVDLPRVSMAFLAVIVSNFGIVSMSFFLSIWYQTVDGRSALGAAVVLLPFYGLSAIAALFSGRLIARIGAAPSLLAGFVLQLAGMAGISQLDATTSYGWQVGFLVLAGFGLAVTLTALAVVLLGAAPPDRGGLMSALQLTANQVAAVLSIALVGAVVASRASARYADGLAAAGLAAAPAPEGLAQGGASVPGPQRSIADEAFSAAIGDGFLIGVAGIAVGLVLSLWLVRRLHAAAPHKS